MVAIEVEDAIAIFPIFEERGITRKKLPCIVTKASISSDLWNFFNEANPNDIIESKSTVAEDARVWIQNRPFYMEGFVHDKTIYTPSSIIYQKESFKAGLVYSTKDYFKIIKTCPILY